MLSLNKSAHFYKLYWDCKSGENQFHFIVSLLRSASHDKREQDWVGINSNSPTLLCEINYPAEVSVLVTNYFYSGFQ